MNGADVFVQLPWKHSAQNPDKNACGVKIFAMGDIYIIKNCSANSV